MVVPDGVHTVFENDVLYPYADIGEHQLMHISYVNEDNRRSHFYKCPYCHLELRPRLGAKKQHCFAHKPGESCDRDHYIHSVAEALLKDKWDGDEPFVVSYKVKSICASIESCLFGKQFNVNCVKDEYKTVNLKELYTQCLIEKKIGDYIPDICLIDESGNNVPLFIEIWNTHPNSDKKNSSGHRIIELRINSMEELEALPKGLIKESERALFYNFDRRQDFDPCSGFFTRKQAQQKLKEKWEHNEHFEITKSVHTECENLASCPFDTYRLCRYDETRTYDLKPHYTDCLIDYEMDGARYDIALVDSNEKNLPILIELNPNRRKDTKNRTISIFMESLDDLITVLNNPITETESTRKVVFSNFKSFVFAPNEECGPSLVRYILSSNLEAKWEEQITCLNYKESRMRPGVLFEIVCRQQDFNTPNDFIKYGNTLAARYELMGTCRRFKPGYSTPFIRDYSMSECPRFCRFFNINGVLTEETKRYNGYPVYNPKLPEPRY